MSSDTPTPRTEQFIRDPNNWHHSGFCDGVDCARARESTANFARQLERELAEYRAATDPHYVDELAEARASNHDVSIGEMLDKEDEERIGLLGRPSELQFVRLAADYNALKAEIERMKIDAGKAYCVYCGTSGPKADIWKHVTVCDKHPLKTMADKMEEASGMIQVAMLIFDELGLSGNATAVTAVESIQKLKAEVERRDAFMVTAAETLRKTEAENERLRGALERIATCLSDSGYPSPMENRLNEACRIISQALASRGRENPSFSDGRTDEGR